MSPGRSVGVWALPLPLPLPFYALLLAVGCHGTPRPTIAACPTSPVRVRSQADLDALRPCTSLAGLDLRGAVPFDLTPLEHLARIEGDLVIRGTFALGSVRLPALTHVGGEIAIIGNLDLAGVYLPALVRARSLVVTDAPPLIEIMLSSLAELPGDLRLARLPSLELVDLSALPAVGGAVAVEAAPFINTWLGPTETRAPPMQSQD